MSMAVDSRAWPPAVIRSLAIGVLAVTAVSGQAVLNDAKKIAEAQKLFDTLRDGPAGCEVLPRSPHFIISLRLQAGYVAHVPLPERPVQGQKWIVLTKITPKDSDMRELLRQPWALLCMAGVLFVCWAPWIADLLRVRHWKHRHR
jgi:hypothetical protein